MIIWSNNYQIINTWFADGLAGENLLNCPLWSRVSPSPTSRGRGRVLGPDSESGGAWATSANQVLIIWWLFELFDDYLNDYLIDYLMIICDYSSLIVWLFDEYLMVIWWLFDDYLMIIWWLFGDYLMIIRF